MILMQQLNMPERKYLSQKENEEISRMKVAGLNAHQIAIKLGLHHVTVGKYLKAPSSYGTAIKDTGRPIKCTSRDERRIINMVREESMSTRDISKAMDHKICKSTVCTILSKSTLRNKKFKIRPLLTKSMSPID